MHRTPDELTKYEICRLIGMRSLQISEDSMFRNDKDPHTVAAEEIYFGRLEFSVRRYLPDNSFEDRHVSTLLIPYKYIADTYLGQSSFEPPYEEMLTS